MEKQNLQAIIEEIWPKVKKKHLYPEIPMPKVKEPSAKKEDQLEGADSGISPRDRGARQVHRLVCHALR